jgi:coenzyme F420 hydrogenase subunit beta
MARTIKTLKDVVDWGLCTGCGACSSACTDRSITLVNIESLGIRPRFDSASCASCTKCLSICPGYTVDAGLTTRVQRQSEADHEFGPALEIWEGWSADPEIRYQASSGGILSALALYCLEREDMAFVLHASMDEKRPWQNITVQSRSRSDILARAGSRYAPASPCDRLDSIEQSDRPCVFIGKPCDTAAVGMLRAQRPILDRNLGLVLSFFCAGTPSTKGTLDLFESMQIDRGEITRVRYRGEGWPGSFKVSNGRQSPQKSLTYEESWGHLSHYRPLRCHLCPDGLGRVADISCGDAWGSFAANKDEGRSLVIVRTPRGREILHRAMAGNYVQLIPARPQVVLVAQNNLLQRRRELFGRLLAFRLFLVPVPNFSGFSLFRSWMQQPFLSKIRTLLGTVQRIITRRLWWRRRAQYS